MLALRSHSHDVTGIVHAILSRTLMFGYKDVSHSLIAEAGEAGLSSGPFDRYRPFHCASSIWNNSGDGRSSLYFSNSCFEVNISRAENTGPHILQWSRSDPGRAGHDRREDHYI